jgi:hypothetical protein
MVEYILNSANIHRDYQDNKYQDIEFAKCMSYFKKNKLCKLLLKNKMYINLEQMYMIYKWKHCMKGIALKFD